MSRFRIATGVLRADLEGEEVLLNPATGMYHVVNATGRELLRDIEHGQSVGESTRRIAESFGEPVEFVRGDVSTFLAAMVERGLLEESVE
ncbi:MAG TPA: PqqD family protein [Actinomycetota bacterium]|nr:PqqD family protein [Actinomycetota bacterium]